MAIEYVESSSQTREIQCMSADVANLPTTVGNGSTALVIDTGEVYTKTATGWERIGG